MTNATLSTPRREVVFSRSLYVTVAVLATGYLLYALRGVLTPLLVAFALAYILDPVADRLEAWKVPRGLAVVVVTLGILLFVLLLFLLIIPSVVSDLANVIRELPGHFSSFMKSLEPTLARYGLELPHTTGEWIARFQGEANDFAGSLLSPAGVAVGWVVGGTVSVIGPFAAALIVPVFAIYLLFDFDRITAGIRDLVPPRHLPIVTSYARDIDHVLGHFVRGQLVIMLIMAVLYGGAYSALGVRLAIPIGIVAGLINFIPYLGSTFALAAGLLMAATGGGGLTQLVGVGVAYALIQSLEGFVITPRIVGQAVGLKDVWVLFALFVGGEIFGFTGVLVGLPAAAVAKVFVARGVERYRASRLFQGGAPAPAS
jgi:predicted PurR-regulated permease PerM